MTTPKFGEPMPAKNICPVCHQPYGERARRYFKTAKDSVFLGRSMWRWVYTHTWGRCRGEECEIPKPRGNW